MTPDQSSGVQEIIEKIEQLKVLELNELVKALEDKFGVSAAMPVMAAAPAAAAATEEPEEEKTTFDVLLAEIGSERIKVIKEVRAISQMGLKEAKEFVEGSLPAKLKEGIPKEEAEEIKKKFEAVGAKVEIK